MIPGADPGQTRRWRRAVASVGLGLVTALVVAACSSSPEVRTPGGESGGAPPVPVQAGQPGAGVPQALDNCTHRATEPSTMTSLLASANPGDRICLTGDLSSTRLELHRSGTPDKPIVVLGGGKARVGGVLVEADNIRIDGLYAYRPQAPGFSLSGKNIAVTNNSIEQPVGGDGDGFRFWGSRITIAHNTVKDTRGRDKIHADCMQTFATDQDHPASQDILIDSNRCEKIDNICLIAEGPNSEAGDGSGEGVSTRFTFTNNFCDNRADQAVFLDNISDVKITNNDIASKIVKAFSLQNDAVGAVIQGNKVPNVRYEVGIDDSSESNYHGPEPGGAP